VHSTSRVETNRIEFVSIVSDQRASGGRLFHMTIQTLRSSHKKNVRCISLVPLSTRIRGRLWCCPFRFMFSPAGFCITAARLKGARNCGHVSARVPRQVCFEQARRRVRANRLCLVELSNEVLERTVLDRDGFEAPRIDRRTDQRSDFR